ncbi:hypothetical protein [Alkalilimnicola ehrlichii]|uniref:SH3b domain-containing protein n=1 Tax=Alkalilimnicola ehrlichii TaxID=351052 RepID=A0A3E0X325_9GAMM|nr:hypothetical protein [Alkalilimnicola ehrlichii]RFA38876.1 hypothetical protein CAL65_02955 [Alkalilimnicola ehrlichii]
MRSRLPPTTYANRSAPSSAPLISTCIPPGRGYPIFHVFQRGDEVEIVSRRTQWLRLRNDSGIEGWTPIEDLGPLADTEGRPLTVRRIERTDYRSRRFEFGIVAGVLDNDGAAGVRLTYHLTALFAGELGYTHVPGTFSSTRVYNLNLVVSPFSHLNFEPVLTVGAGYFENVPRPTLVDGEPMDDSSANFGVGIRNYFSDNFLLRADIRHHIVFVDDDNEGFTEATVGFAAFF